MAVVDQVVDETLDALRVGEEDAALARARHDAVEENAWRPASLHGRPELLPVDAHGGEEQTVDLMVEQCPQRGQLPARVLA